MPRKDDILSAYWDWYKVDSLRGQWDYIESVLFGYASAKVIELFYKCYLNLNNKVVAHYNEWMTGSGVLYLNKALPQVGTVFTTHATVVGRVITSYSIHYTKLYDGAYVKLSEGVLVFSHLILTL